MESTYKATYMYSWRVKKAMLGIRGSQSLKWNESECVRDEENR